MRSVPRAAGPAGDLDMVVRCRRGDGTAWRSLYDRYAPVVHRFLAAFGVPTEEREDACQEVFVAVYRSLGRFRGASRRRRPRPTPPTVPTGCGCSTT